MAEQAVGQPVDELTTAEPNPDCKRCLGEVELGKDGQPIARASCAVCKGIALPRKCKHGTRLSRCKTCGGGSVCCHGRMRYRCKKCKQPKQVQCTLGTFTKLRKVCEASTLPEPSSHLLVQGGCENPMVVNSMVGVPLDAALDARISTARAAAGLPPPLTRCMGAFVDGDGAVASPSTAIPVVGAHRHRRPEAHVPVTSSDSGLDVLVSTARAAAGLPPPFDTLHGGFR